MIVCPMCGMPLDRGAKTCEFCDYEPKPLSELTENEISELMASYEYEMTEDGGCRIIAVKNIRDISLRGSVSVPHFVTEIADGAYSCCKFLARIELPECLRSIGSEAFAYCRDLFDVYIPETVTHIGRKAFADCYDLGEISCAAESKPDGWDDAWLEGCDAKVQWRADPE